MQVTQSMPKEAGIDHSLSLIREGYMYILNRRRSFNSDIFETRLFGQKAICMGGKEAAELFYDPEKFKRKGAAPNRIIQTLFGPQGVQTLDEEEHKQRKAIFMSPMSPAGLKKISEIVTEQWEQANRRWEQLEQIILYEEVQEILCRAACQWAGVPVEEKEVKGLTKDLAAMFESAATAGPAHWLGRHARNRVEKWLAELVNKIRKGKEKPEENSILHSFTWQRDLEGNPLEPKVVAVEVINILRPIVAVSIYINFIALTLHHSPEQREKLQSGGASYAHYFVQEVRRFYPFFPFVAALVNKDFTWQGYMFEEGTLTLLDLYGTNHDPKLWDNPDVFDPNRFAHWEENPFTFIPQGGGDYFLGHRCAGEWLTIEIMKVSLDFLANRLTYEVPEQDLSYSMVTMPSIPHSRVIIENVKRKGNSDPEYDQEQFFLN